MHCATSGHGLARGAATSCHADSRIASKRASLMVHALCTRAKRAANVWMMDRGVVCRLSCWECRGIHAAPGVKPAAWPAVARTSLYVFWLLSSGMLSSGMLQPAAGVIAARPAACCVCCACCAHCLEGLQFADVRACSLAVSGRSEIRHPRWKAECVLPRIFFFCMPTPVLGHRALPRIRFGCAQADWLINKNCRFINS